MYKAEQVFFIGSVVMIVWKVQRLFLPHHIQDALSSSEGELLYLGFSSPPYMHSATDYSSVVSFYLHIPAKQKCLAVVSSTDQSIV